jgi:hypothetical protein
MVKCSPTTNLGVEIANGPIHARGTDTVIDDNNVFQLVIKASGPIHF